MKPIRLSRASSRFMLRFLPLALLLVVSGCGLGQGKVTGRVLFDGKPLPGGRVVFFPQIEGQNSVLTLLDELGNYSVELPACEVKVTVNNQELKPRPKLDFGVPPGLPGGAAQKLATAKKESPQKAAGTVDPGMHGKLPGRYVEIPAKYYNVTSTPLSFTVSRGDQTHDLELTK